jgi:large subunit ribosomal protein L21
VTENIMYAVVRAGGKQYSVREGQLLEIERIDGNEGDRVELSEVLLVSDGDRLSVGTPTVPGARVVAEVLGQARAKKVIIFKYKRKTRYRRKLGHRQPFTRLAVREIVAG